MNAFFGRKVANSTRTQRAVSKLMVTSALVAVGTFGFVSSANAVDFFETPTNPVIAVGNGAATVSTSGFFNQNLNVNQSTDRVIIDWNTFNIGTGAKVQFYQPNSGSLAVNRVSNDGQFSSINGRLIANGKVMILDPNGVMFGAGSIVDVGAIIASTGDIDAARVMAGDLALQLSNFGTGEIVNNGLINAKDSGLVAFVGPTVKNNGIINAKAGRVSLAAGNETATVDLYGDGLVELAYTNKDDKLTAENNGAITAVGGTIQMSAAKAKDIVDSVVNMKGIATVNSVFVKDGKIVLSGKKVKVNKNAVVIGDTEINADSADLGTTILGDVTGDSKEVNILSNKAKIAQGLGAVGENGTVNVAAGTYNEHLVVDTAGVTLKSTAGAVINPNSPGVEITADNVTVDGLIFENAMGLDGYGIFVNGGNYATLTNNIIRNVAQSGIYLLDSIGSIVSGNTIYNTGSHGIYAVGSANTEILANAIGTLGGNNNINGDGVLLDTSNGSVVKGNTITETTMTAGEIGSGVHLLNSSNITVGGALLSDANTISNAEWDAVKVTNGSNILVEGNDFDGLKRVGVFAKGTNGIIVRNNDIDDAKMYGVQYTDVKGASEVVGNTIDTVGIDGVYIYFSNNVKITDNIIGYGADEALGGDDTVIGRDGISIVYSGGTNASGNKVANTKRNGVYVQGKSGVVLSNNTIDFTSLSGVRLLDTTGAQITGNKIGTLGGNNNINGDGLLIETSNGTVVKGNTITETTSTAGEIGSGVHILNSNNVTVGGALPSDKNTISNAEWDAVKVTNGSGILVEGNDFDNLVRVGVFAKGTNGITVRGNDIDGAKMYGVQFQDVVGNSSVVSNLIDTVGIDGINLYFSTNVKVTDNIIGYGNSGSFNGGDDTVIGRDGISSVYSAGSDISGNKVTGTKRNGINVEGKSGVKLTANTVNKTGKSGVYLLNTTGTQITGNQIGTLGGTNNINGDGVLVQTSNGVVIKGNTISNTKSTASEVGSGVHLLNSNDAVVGGALLSGDANIISNAEWDAVKITNGSNILVEGNDFDNLKRVGVYALNTNGLNILNNDIDVAQMYGVQVDGVTGVTNIIGNTIDKVGFDGISVRYGAKNVNIQDNVIGYGVDGVEGTADDKKAGRDGISVVYSTGTNIEGNFITNTGRHGVYAQAAAGTNVIGNTIDKVVVDGVNLVSASNSIVNENTIGYGADGFANTSDDTIIGRDGVRVEKSSTIYIDNNNIVNAVANGIHSINGSDFLQINGNTIDNSGDNGILVEGFVSSLIPPAPLAKLLAVNGLFVNGNTITNSDDNGIEVVNTSGTVEINDNDIEESGYNGIYVHNYGYDDMFSLFSVGSDDLILTIAGNTISDSNIGINLSSINGDITVSGNDISDSNYDGVYAEYVNQDGGYSYPTLFEVIEEEGEDASSYQLTISENDIDDSGFNGIELYQVGGLVTIASNHITNSGYNGILAYNSSEPFISDEGQDNEGFEEFFSKDYYYGGNPIELHIVNNIIENVGSGDGEGNGDGNDEGSVILKISNEAPFGFAAVNVDVSGNGYVELSGNTLGNNFEYGLVAYSGTIDLTGATNTIQNTTIGMGFYPAGEVPESDSEEYFDYLANQLSLVDDTIGTTAFVDQSELFVDLGYGAMYAPGTPTILDGNNATYTLGGVTIDPAANGGFVTLDELNTLESFINHYNDTQNRGLFFFSVFPSISSFSIDQKDVLRELFVPFGDEIGGSLTITGLPSIGGPAGAPPAPGAFDPNAIEPAAGDEEGAPTGDVAAIEPAAGGEIGCWADATQSLGQGTPVTFNFGGSSALLQDAANCGNGQAQGQSL